MYISANKVNITHSYTPQQGSTSPSTAGHKETSEPLPRPELETKTWITKPQPPLGANRARWRIQSERGDQRC